MTLRPIRLRVRRGGYLRLLAASAYLLSPLLLSQSASTKAPAVVHIKVDEIQAGCIVEDSHSAPVSGLTKEDFKVQIDGRPVPIRSLGTNADVPISISILLDVSLSQKGMLPIYTEVLRSLRAELQPDRDRVNVYTFGGSVRLYRDWTAASALDPEQLRRIDPGAGVVLQKNPWYTHGGTRLFDAILDAIDHDREVQGRKALVILTDGIDEGSHASSAKALRGAQQGNVSLSAMEFSPSMLAVLSPSAAFKTVHDSLSSISNGSGGIFLHAKSGAERDQIASMVRLLKEQYSVAFKAPDSEAGFHALSIELSGSRRDVTVRSRTRVWLPGAGAPR